MRNDTLKHLLNWSSSLIGKQIKSSSKEPHGDEGLVFKLTTETGGIYFLKTKEGNSRLLKERERLEWFHNRLPVPKIIGTTDVDGISALLLSGVPGMNLKTLCAEWPPEKIVKKLVDALKRLHSIDITEWPFDSQGQNKVLVHGDACLPNFIFEGEELSGYIDLGGAHIDTPEIDLAAAVWSLRHNLGRGHESDFLKLYGYEDTSDEAVERLQVMYVDFQKDHGFSVGE